MEYLIILLGLYVAINLILTSMVIMNDFSDPEFAWQGKWWTLGKMLVAVLFGTLIVIAAITWQGLLWINRQFGVAFFFRFYVMNDFHDLPKDRLEWINKVKMRGNYIKRYLFNKIKVLVNQRNNYVPSKNNEN